MNKLAYNRAIIKTAATPAQENRPYTPEEARKAVNAHTIGSGIIGALGTGVGAGISARVNDLPVLPWALGGAAVGGLASALAGRAGANRGVKTWNKRFEEGAEA